MSRCTNSFAAAAVLAALFHHTADSAAAQTVAGVRVRVDVTKKLTREEKSSHGPVLVGPQEAVELEWRIHNSTGGVLELPSPDAFLSLRVARAGRPVAVQTQWAREMTLLEGANAAVTSTTVPLGAATLPDGASVWVHGSTRTLDGSAFAPAEYVVEPGGTAFEQVSPGGARTILTIDRGAPIQLRILPLDSPQRQRQFHMKEGAFYRRRDSGRALEHYTALASLPAAPWSDSLPLATMYGELGRHLEASMVFRRILPELVRALDGPLGETIRDGRHLRRAAMSLAVTGDVPAAANLLELERRTPKARISHEVERLRQAAPRAAANPK